MTGRPAYSIRRIYRKSPSGITQPRFAAIDAVLKFDSPDVPRCVFNEVVATALAQTFHAPNANGVLAAFPGSYAFASLKVADPGISLPDIRKSWVGQLASTYPDQVAALVAFDIFIGNTDRYQNIKASLFTPHIKLFAAFDHSHSLLHPFVEPDEAINRLASNDLIANRHTFYGLVSRAKLNVWSRRIASTQDYLIRECCMLGRTLNTVDEKTQAALADALVFRARELPSIVRAHSHVIRSIP